MNIRNAAQTSPLEDTRMVRPDEVEGVCRVCGEPAEYSDGHVCESCAGLLERVRTEKREQDRCLELVSFHKVEATKVSGFAKCEQLALATEYQARADVAYYRYRMTKDRLDTAEIAFTETIVARRVAS
jgi:hypothetical protein